VTALPQRKAAILALKKNHRNKMHNQDVRSGVKKTIKDFLASVELKKKDEATTNLKLVYKKLDKAVKDNVLHKNTAARRKSRFSKLLASIA
jgi:small subunit ribosomal protein S20